MNGIYIIEAMNDLDDAMLLDARTPRKTAPTWLRYVSVAACLCCVLLGFLLINRLILPGEENVPDTLTPGDESAYGSEFENEESETTVTLSSSQYPVTLTVPEEYADNVQVDTPYIDSSLYEPFDLDLAVSFHNVIFSFHAYFFQQSASEGMAWVLTATPIEEFDFETYQQSARGLALVLSHTVIGTDNAYVYQIIHPGHPQYFYDATDLESTRQYLQYLQAGLSILDTFAVENSLETEPDWRQLYSDLTIAPVEAQLAKLESQATENPEADTDNAVSQAESAYEFQHVLFSYGSMYDTDELRVTNLRLACEAINGTILQPGESFSFNDIVGERSAAKGYRVAPVYPADSSNTALGGGVSQVSSTLYLCCLHADLEILERHGHLYQPDCVPAGRDAAVSWGTQDFRFTNSTDDPIRIDAYLSDGRIYIDLLSTADDGIYTEIDTSTSSNESQLTCCLTRSVFDDEGNLLRVDSTEALDDLGGLGTTVYDKQTDAAPAP